MSHTPGPWSCDYGVLSVFCDTGAEVAACVRGNHDDGSPLTCDEMECNLNLLAAAPELLAALKLLRDPSRTGRWPCYCSDPEYAGEPCENCIATAAIDKAEGRADETTPD